MWLNRLSVFDEDNPYYIQDGKFNVYQDSIRLPNCVVYAKLRQAEECELEEPQSIFTGRSATGFPDAKNWYSQTTLSKGSQIKDGAIAVFNGNCGHVAVIEKKLSDTRALISQSQWTADKSIRDYRYWQLKEIDLIVGQSTMSGVGALIGFIYPTINDKRVDNGTIEVTEDYVNARKEPNGDLVAKGLYVPMGRYNPIKVKNDGTYDWYKLDSNCWIRDGKWIAKHESGNIDYKSKYEAILADMKKIKEITNKW